MSLPRMAWDGILDGPRRTAISCLVIGSDRQPAKNSGFLIIDIGWQKLASISAKLVIIIILNHDEKSALHSDL